jgi:hypothetical protein
MAAVSLEIDDSFANPAPSPGTGRTREIQLMVMTRQNSLPDTSRREREHARLRD